MAGMLEYKCPCCDGAIQFDSATQKMKCPYCDTEFDVDTLKGYDEELKDEKPSEMEWATPGGSWAEGETAGLHTYSCKSCGGEIVGDDTMAASACPFCSMPSLNLSGDELLTVGEPDSSGDYYFAAFDLDGNELARSSQPVGSFDAVMMKRPNGYLLDTGYMWELYAPDGTFLEKSLPVGERETLCQLCGDFCIFDVFLPLAENAFLAVGHHGKATEPDEPVVFRITTDF